MTTHPIQYMVPWFRALAAEPGVMLDVIFFREPNPREQGEGFGIDFTWDVPLRRGYASTVLGYSQGLNPLGGLIGALRRALQFANPNVVLITGWNEPGLIAAYPIVRLMGLPIIARGESNLLRRRSWRTSLFHRLLLSMASAVVTIGRSNRAFYLANGVLPGRLFPGCYFVDSERMLAMAKRYAPERARLRAAQGFGDDDVVFCFVGKHVSFKRPMLVIEAAAKLRARGLPVKLLIAGSGELTSVLRQCADQNQVPAHFTGFINQTELWQAYIPADALVLPSDEGETWGLVANEAMLFGLPLIVSDKVGCGPDLVRDGETGYVFAGSLEGLADSMEKVVEDSGRRRWMGEQGRRLVQRDYSMPVATAGLRAALDAVLQPR